VRYLTLSEALELHRRVIGQSGGALGVLNLGLLESALAQPRMSFAGSELYPSIVDKAASLGYSLIQNHPFVDGNKRTGHAAMEVFLLLNGFEIQASVDEQERIILQAASGEIDRETFTGWLRDHVTAKST
jgi:death-on-curing protein